MHPKSYDRHRNLVPRLLLGLACLLLATACGAPRSARPPDPPIAPATDRGPRPAPDYSPRNRRPPHLSAEMVNRCRALIPLFERVGREFGLEPALLMAITRVESGFHDRARSHAGARGLMQIMPATGQTFSCGRLHDPQANIRCGARVLAHELKRFNGNKIYALAAYNGGAGYVRDEYRAKRLPRNFRYVEDVLKYLSFFRRYGCRGGIAHMPPRPPEPQTTACTTAPGLSRRQPKPDQAPPRTPPEAARPLSPQ